MSKLNIQVKSNHNAALFDEPDLKEINHIISKKYLIDNRLKIQVIFAD